MAQVSHPGGPPMSMPGIPGGSDSPLDWALRAVAAASRQQQHAPAAPTQAGAWHAAPQHAASASAAVAARQGPQPLACSLAEGQLRHQQMGQHSSNPTTIQRDGQQRQAEVRTAPVARPPQHPRGAGPHMLATQVTTEQ